MSTRSNATLNAVFSALADPTRRAILEHLARGEQTVTTLAEPHEISLPAVSKHLKVLEEAGLIVRAKDGRIHRMNLNSKPMKDAAAWLERYRAFWEGRFDALEKFLNTPTK
ncbi:MAG TPA: metalloregulator ArsR/SmtB family transcription factor [Bacteroidota bacterium]|nr:metalloregulator ArsR/SmtB family transcription factor [Bacteroidota bacterium]